METDVLKEYNSIIHYRQQNQLINGGEVHHIIPKTCGGPNEKWNLVRLTTFEHIRCHRLLCDIYASGRNHEAMCKAYACLTITRKGITLTDEEAAEARRLSSEVRKGKRLSLEHRLKMSAAHKGKPSGTKGKKLSAATRQRMREARYAYLERRKAQ